MMKKLILEQPIYDERGVHVMKGQTLGNALAKALMHAAPTNETDIEKFHRWAGVLGKSEELEVDDSDLKKLKAFIVLHPELHTIVKQPLVKEFDKLIIGNES